MSAKYTPEQAAIAQQLQQAVADLVAAKAAYEQQAALLLNGINDLSYQAIGAAVAANPVLIEKEHAEKLRRARTELRNAALSGGPSSLRTAHSRFEGIVRNANVAQ